MKTCCRALVYFSLALSTVSLGAAPRQYSITEVGSLGGTYNVGHRINNSGDIAGESAFDISGGLHYWTGS
jgi:hypothetical protein